MISSREPELSSFIFANVLNHDRLEDALSHRLAQRLDHDVTSDLIRQTFAGLIEEEARLGSIFRADLAAVLDRDPACRRYVEPFLYFKGFHALQTYRFAHVLWHRGRKDFALYLQSQSSRVFGVDIHPAAHIGRGIMFDHATGIVIGETAVIGNDVSILHGVTLGGTGKDSGDRHPKVGDGVLIGAGASVLGNVHIGTGAKIGAGAVVLRDVPEGTTAVGNPAKEIGKKAAPQRRPDEQPGVTMEQRWLDYVN
jgi:serine O-acetyltransferase